MTIHELQCFCADTLLQAGIGNGRQEAAFMLEAVLRVDRGYLFLHREDEVTAEQEETYRAWTKRRAEHYPMQYLIGEQPFMDYSFLVNASVLIPRQETEVLVSEAAKHIRPDMRVLDMCCGSGCIGISLAKMTGAKVTLSDLSEDALSVAEENAKRLQADVEFRQGDLFSDIHGRYDIIVSNPPYIKSAVIDTLMPEVRDYEPRMALDGMEDGLHFYRRIIKEARRFLNEQAMLMFEIGYDQGADLREILVEAHFRDIRVMQDLAGLDRVVSAVWDGGVV